MPLSQDEKSQLLAATPLFEGVAADDIGGIADRSIEVDYPPGGVIARHHAQVAAVFVGRQKIEIAGVQANQHRRIAHLACRVAQGNFLAPAPVLVPPGMAGSRKQRHQQSNRKS